MSIHASQLVKFSAVGLVCLVASTGTFALLCEHWHVDYPLAYVLCFVFSTVLGFTLNGRYTFCVHRAFDGAALTRYMSYRLLPSRP